MAKRKDIDKVLIIGSGPIIIGQACEFDYSGTQACKALRSLGYKIVLVNSNPATIMTDPGTADVTYIEPLNEFALTEIIKKERPDALLPNLGGQTGLNLSSLLAKKGILEKYGVKVIGVNIDAIERGEDRTAFKETMNLLGIEMPESTAVNTVEDAERVASELGYPVVLRPAYTMGGTGGGLVYNVEELRTICSRGLSASIVNQVLVEESVLGWEELELEVVRDAKNQMITVCFIENVDAMGVHTGDSFCTAPMLTISPELQARLQKYSYDIVEAIEVIGGTNVQFAHDPETGKVVVIEINPRTSRSSALASKATGFPIALVSSLLAGGLTMDEIPYWRDGTLEKYTPSGDYVVVKFARWAFEKFDGLEDKLGTQMQAVGEVMSIGKNYKEAFQKAIRSLENGRYGLGFAKDFNKKSLDDLLAMLKHASSERQFIMYEALRKGADIDDLFKRTHIKTWFISQMKELVDLEEEILKYKGKVLPDDLFIQAKKDGFADRYLSLLLDIPEKEIRDKRISLGMKEAWEPVPVSGVENAAYYFSTYNAPDAVEVSDNKKIMVLGGGPNRIGQGIEFDYCCVHAAKAIREAGYESIMVNCNPETVSTDYDTSDKLYFEPLTVEDVLSIYYKEKPEGVIVQFGGQTPWNIAERTNNPDLLHIFRYFARLRMNLLPYILHAAKQSASTGLPMMRALCLAYPQDKELAVYPYQYMFGESILVAPIVQPDLPEVEVYLPEGDWYSFWDDQLYPGGSVYKLPTSLEQIPVFVRANSLLPLNLDSTYRLGSDVGNGLDVRENLCFKFYPTTNCRITWYDETEQDEFCFAWDEISPNMFVLRVLTLSSPIVLILPEGFVIDQKTADKSSAENILALTDTSLKGIEVSVLVDTGGK